MSIVAKRLDGLMPHGKEVDLGPGDIVLDVTQFSPKGAQPPILCLLWPSS